MKALTLPSVLALPWSFGRGVDRTAYLAAGLVFAAIKYAGDAALVWAFLGRAWTPLDYLGPVDLAGQAFGPGWVPAGLLPLMALWALPFLWVGITLTMRRAIDAGVSPWLAFAFFVPYVNYVCMAAFALLPSKASAGDAGRPQAPHDGRRLSAMLAGAGAGLAVGVVMAIVSVLALRTYGGPLFLATPFVIGAVAAAVMRRRCRAEFGDVLRVAVLAVTLLAGGAVLLAFEGVGCVVMAYPLALLLALLGAGSVGLIGGSNPRGPLSIAGLAMLPLAVVLEPAGASGHLMHEVRSSIEITASPDVAWRHVVTFPPLDPPAEIEFRAGIAYPIEARIEGEGVGAVRYCIFSTGAFVEPITRWEPGRRLSFDVVESPRPLAELSPYGSIDAPHLDGFLRSRRGEFRLVPLPGGRTRLEGSTWYQIEMAPEGYWQVIADHLIGRIHMRVLRHIKAQAETGDADSRRLADRRSESEK
jgi:uncharacterized membrane protein YhaH (DUF805 family)